MSVSGSLGFGVVVVDDLVVAFTGGVAAVDGEELLDPLVAEVEAPDPVDSVPVGEPVEQEAVRVTARAAAVTAGSGRMSAECRSP
ncbi:MAG: hypothetical protein ABIQ13_13370 [Pedococcus sp.]